MCVCACIYVYACMQVYACVSAVAMTVNTLPPVVNCGLIEYTLRVVFEVSKCQM